jgi:aryl sulfotransferase
LPEVFKRISQEYNETLFFKTHDAWTLTQESKSIFPEELTKGVIYIIRNPLDIAVSYSYHNGNKIDKTINDMNRKAYSVCSDEKELKIQLPQIMGSWSEHVDSWIRESNLPVHIMRYEDMLDNTNKSFTDALKFLDMKFSRKEGFKERSIHSDSFFRKGLQDDWKNVLTPSQVEKIVNQHSEMMRKFGYLN